MSPARLSPAACLRAPALVAIALTLQACSTNAPHASAEEIFLTRVNVACAKATKGLPSSITAEAATTDPTLAEKQLKTAAVVAFRQQRQTLNALIAPMSLAAEYKKYVLDSLPAIEVQYVAVLTGTKTSNPKKLLADALAGYVKLRTFYTAHKVNACLASIPPNA